MSDWRGGLEDGSSGGEDGGKAYHRDTGAIVELEIGDRGVDVGHSRWCCWFGGGIRYVSLCL